MQSTITKDLHDNDKSSNMISGNVFSFKRKIVLKGSVWPEKNRQMSIKVAQKWFHQKKDNFHNFTKIA